MQEDPPFTFVVEGPPPPRKRRVVDMFMFFNETKLLAARMRTLGGVVDRFVLAEGTVTQAGHPKPMYTKPEGDPRLSCVAYDPDPAFVAAAVAFGMTPHWARENGQRNALLEGLRALVLEGAIGPDDVALVGDLDEIPRPSAVAALAASDFFDVTAAGGARGRTIAFQQRLFYGDFTVECDKVWNGTVAARVGDLLDGVVTPQSMRNGRNHGLAIVGAGWHCSCFGTPDAILHKFHNMAHQEYNTPANASVESIRGHLERGEDILGRPELTFRKVSLADQVDLPPFTADEVRLGEPTVPPGPLP